MSRTHSDVAISVLMPVYNGARYLRCAIDSVLNQSCRNFELIAVDDGSADESGEILSDYQRGDGRITVISRGANSGLVQALNCGLQRARGEFVARMDADDICHPQRFEMQLSHMSSHPRCVLLGTAVRQIDADGDPVKDVIPHITHEEIEARLLRGLTATVYHPSAMIRASAIRQIDGYRDYSTSEDLDLFLRLCEVGQAANLPSILLYYRLHGTSYMSDVAFDGRRRNRNAIIADAMRRRGIKGVSRDVGGHWRFVSTYDMHRKIACTAATSGYMRTAMKHAISAFRTSPFSRTNIRMIGRIALEAMRYSGIKIPTLICSSIRRRRVQVVMALLQACTCDPYT